MVTVKQSDNGFYVGDSEKTPLAEIILSYEGETIIKIEHTNVSDLLRGQNVGKKLLQSVAELARKENKKIIPLCPFASKEMTKNVAEYEDILFK